jgi:DNA-binding CsgD family transcriptional regulator
MSWAPYSGASKTGLKAERLSGVVQQERGKRSVIPSLLVSGAAGGRHRAGLGAAKPVVAGSPHGLQLPGRWDAARTVWAEAGCPCDAALCLADADDEDRSRLALNELLGLDARPAAAIVARRLRDRGVMSLPRRPRATTRQNRYGLTLRELEVLALVNEGLRNGQIADRLVVSARTVDHHVEAVLHKLRAKTRADARATATSLGIAVAAS